MIELTPGFWEEIAQRPLSSVERRAVVRDLLEQASALVPKDGWPLVELEAEVALLDLRRIGKIGDDYMLRRRLHGFMPGDGDRAYSMNSYVHRILRADEDPLPHSHPWEWAVSLVLRGGYVEQRPARYGGTAFYSRVAGTVHEFDGETFHKITDVIGDCWTLFVTGPKIASWGFLDEQRGVIPWRERLRERGIRPDY